MFHGVFVYQDNLNDINVTECNKIMLKWINSVRDSMNQELGYDGLSNIKYSVRRNRRYKFNKNSHYEDVKNYIETYKWIKGAENVAPPPPAAHK